MPDEITAIAALDEPARKALYDTVRAATEPMTREDAAAATGVSRKLAAFHLDKLVAVGLLVTAPAPGPRQVGRAPKAYAAGPDAVQVSVPARTYADLASILLQAVDEQRGDEQMSNACRRVAARRGSEAGRSGTKGPAADRVRAALASAGYEPYDGPDRSLRLRNCPFHPLAAQHTEFVCGVNGAFLSGVLDGARASGMEVVALEPAGRCCAEIRRRSQPAAGASKVVRDNDAHDR